ncbi:hypothetical protein PoB_004379600 [Plakobranchus ocellatus]|uniref:Uncharacterized protein n=1 Tax=Plakobranchus ocellatus TaxID=259542 RepID=A0AAV4B1P8_9GAST|nr:hypothetical protein PoB_004379600 [Plakobranchus ocellatus]
MAPPFPLSDRSTDVRPGCKTQRIAPTVRQVADLVCARTKERECFKTCIVGHVNCCLQCGPTLNCKSSSASQKRDMASYRPIPIAGGIPKLPMETLPCEVLDPALALTKSI